MYACPLHPQQWFLDGGICSGKAFYFEVHGGRGSRFACEQRILAHHCIILHVVAAGCQAIFPCPPPSTKKSGTPWVPDREANHRSSYDVVSHLCTFSAMSSSL
eukprot:GGOE01007950.1.p2 GENE.GGOE01007950.1~~GGOE01007950.1.p2  ORF type:complete len:103 (+),score=1.72 GGOE01007950.1:237-545(+)